MVPTFVSPEGWYFSGPSFCYVPIQATFTGFHSFRYALVDEFGAEGPPATVSIEISED